VSVKETSVCIVDDAGKIVREARAASEPEALLQVLTNTIYRFKRIGLEAGPLSQWLYSVLAEAGLPVICVETRHMRAMSKAQINKTDRNDARGFGTDDAGGALSPGACEDVTQSVASGAADPSQAASIEGHCHRERPACHLAQLRPQGRHDRAGQVRNAYSGARAHSLVVDPLDFNVYAITNPPTEIVPHGFVKQDYRDGRKDNSRCKLFYCWCGLLSAWRSCQRRLLGRLRR
jgi:Transposase